MCCALINWNYLSFSSKHFFFTALNCLRNPPTQRTYQPSLFKCILIRTLMSSLFFFFWVANIIQRNNFTHSSLFIWQFTSRILKKLVFQLLSLINTKCMQLRMCIYIFNGGILISTSEYSWKINIYEILEVNFIYKVNIPIISYIVHMHMLYVSYI